MNDLEGNNISDFNNIVIMDSSLASTYDWYDYREVIERQDTIIENQNNIFGLLNDGFTFICCTLIVLLLYNLIRNMIRK